ncbi:MAG: hypothetical protein JW861_06555, partial [Bacteroidales bacterium]|nr:hypothetical protein [Bacteroidales bacterium]
MKETIKTIVVEPVVHPDERRLKLVFGYDDELIALVKGIEGRQWSASMKCWHIPDDVIRFTQDHILANRLSHAYQNQFINALKLFFKHVL